MGEKTFLELGDDFVRNYYIGSPSAQRVYLRSVRRCIEAAAIRPGERVLDVGCGTGVLLSEMPAGSRLFGIDNSPVMLGDARRRVARARLSQAMAGRLPFGTGTCDVVLSRAVLQHIDDPVGVLREIARVLRPGGRFVLFMPVFSWLGAVPRALARTLLRKPAEIRGEEVSASTVLGWLEAAGFRASVSRGWGSIFYILSGYGSGVSVPGNASPLWERLIDLDERLPGSINILVRAERADGPVP